MSNIPNPTIQIVIDMQGQRKVKGETTRSDLNPCVSNFIISPRSCQDINCPRKIQTHYHGKSPIKQFDLQLRSNQSRVSGPNMPHSVISLNIYTRQQVPVNCRQVKGQVQGNTRHKVKHTTGQSSGEGEKAHSYNLPQDNESPRVGFLTFIKLFNILQYYNTKISCKANINTLK